MDLPLPLDQFWFNVILRVLITAYGAAWIWNFMAFIPWCNKEDAEILWYKNKSNYSFRLLSSILFFLLWISQFQYPSLIFISIWEIYLIIVIYFVILIKKRSYSEKNKTKTYQINKKKYTDTTNQKRSNKQS
jgi:hypothetical protein